MAHKRATPAKKGLQYSVRPEWDADKVRALRAHLGYTQQRMSEELGTRQQTISEWETGQYCPRGATVTLLNIVAERAGFEYAVDKSEPNPQPAPNKTDQSA